MPMKVRYETINGEVMSETRGGVHKQYIPDPLGSTVALMDDTQTITDTFSYWPYGEVASRTGTTETPFQFVGTSGYYVDSSRSTYIRFRCLGATTARWTSCDPLLFGAGDYNVYRYARNNPTNYIDTSGQDPGDTIRAGCITLCSTAWLGFLCDKSGPCYSPTNWLCTKVLEALCGKICDHFNKIPIPTPCLDGCSGVQPVGTTCIECCEKHCPGDVMGVKVCVLRCRRYNPKDDPTID